jgi:hypothetical protein
MSAVLHDDDRSGPEARRIPEHGDESIRDRTNNETPDAPQIADDIRKAAEDKKAGRQSQAPWCPDGFYWGYNKQGDAVLKPQEWYVKDIAKDADQRFIRAMEKHGRSEELKAIIEAGSEELRGYLQSRRALNDKAFSRKAKAEADDAAYQIVQAAKYRKDGINMMENNRRNGYKAENEKVKNLRHYADQSLYEGYALTMIVLKACDGSDYVPVFDYEAAAWRVCNYSAQRLTESLMAKQRNDKASDKLEDEAVRVEANAYFD